MGACWSSDIPVQWKEVNGRQRVLLKSVLRDWRVVIQNNPVEKLNLMPGRIYLCLPESFVVTRIKDHGFSSLECTTPNPSMTIKHKMTGKDYFIVLPLWYEPETQLTITEEAIYRAGEELTPDDAMFYKATR